MTKFVVTEFGAFSTAEYRNEQSGRLCQPFAQFNGAQFIGIELDLIGKQLCC